MACRACARIEQGRVASGRGGGHQIVVYLVAATGAGAGNRLVSEYEKLGLEPVVLAGTGDDAVPTIRNPIRMSGAAVRYLLPSTLPGRRRR